MKKDIKQRGLKPAVPPKDDWHIKHARALPIKNNPSSRLDKHFIFDEKKGIYRIYTENTKYRTRYDNIDETGEGELQEIIFDNEKQCFTINNLNKLREKWNDTHKDKVIRDIDRDFDEFNMEKF